jgi:polyketide synthase PksL
MGFENIATIIHNNSKKFPDKTALVFIKKNVSDIHITYEELDRRVGNLAYIFSQKKLTHKKVILFYPLGLDYIITYLACLYAGVIPVPIVYDVENFSMTKKMAISAINTTRSDIVLTKSELTECLYKIISNDQFEIIETATEMISNRFYLYSHYKPNDTAYIQSTSATTGQFKCVQLTHNNIVTSLMDSANFWSLTPNDISCSRTPHFHVYGLIIGVLQPLFCGNTNYIIDHHDIIRDSLYWLWIISKYRVTYSGPNFDYTAEFNDIDPTIDLSSWRIAILGGDVISPYHIQQFIKKFKPYGFSETSLCVSYGMTEMTGFISATGLHDTPKTVALDQNALRLNRVVENNNGHTVLSSGKFNKANLKIINRDTLLEVTKNEIGEICVTGATLSNGYFNSCHPFKLIQLHDGCYFRTGDIGFILEDELYLLSRYTEVISIADNQYYSIEIETTIKQAIPFLAHNAMVVVSLRTEIALLIEAKADLSPQDKISLKQSINENIFSSFGLNIKNILFLTTGTLPRTYSGKLKKTEARQLYFEWEKENSHFML